MADGSTLRIVSFNTWGGMFVEPLIMYLRDLAPTTDIFCLQEILDAPRHIPLECGFRTDLFSLIEAALPEFAGRFDAIVGWDEPVPGSPGTHPETQWVSFGLATFHRRTLPILDQGCEPLIEHDDTLDAVPGGHFRTLRKLQWTRVRTSRRPLLVATMHGVSRPGTKLDNPDRLLQSRRVQMFLDRHVGPSLLVGDLNLPETESIRILEQGRRNLIAEYRIRTTRSRKNQYYGTPQEQPHANYAFATPDLTVLEFTVPEDVEVSDHLPLLLTVGA
jgi:endonuclease/exonuclease/phosphatase (EEP) superfamily protein YafD